MLKFYIKDNAGFALQETREGRFVSLTKFYNRRHFVTGDLALVIEKYDADGMQVYYQATTCSILSSLCQNVLTIAQEEDPSLFRQMLRDIEEALK